MWLANNFLSKTISFSSKAQTSWSLIADMALGGQTIHIYNYIMQKAKKKWEKNRWRGRESKIGDAEKTEKDSEAEKGMW